MKFAYIGIGLLLATGLSAQRYVISTVAGGAPPATPIQATNAALGSAWGVATDSIGNLYISATSLHCIFKVDVTGTLNRIAGTCRPGYSGDGGLAVSAQLHGPRGIAVDAASNVYIADLLNNVIRKVSPTGIISTVAGNGTVGFSGDGGPATSAQLSAPVGIAIGGGGNLFIADANNNRIRRFSTDGTIATVAGSGTVGFSGDGGPATNAQLNQPSAVTVGAGNNLYIADTQNQRIRRVSPAGVITTVAGNGTAGFAGDGGFATSAQLYFPLGIAVDASGNVFIPGYSRVRKVTPAGAILAVAGNGMANDSGDGGPATSAGVKDPIDVAIDAVGNLYIAGSGRIRKVSAGGTITTVAGNGSGYSGDGGPATSAELDAPQGVATDSAGNLYIADTFNYRVRKVSSGGTISTVAGVGTAGYLGDHGPAISAYLSSIYDVAVDKAGNLYISESNRIRKVTAAGIITTVAGNESYGYSGDGGPATSAQLNIPQGLAVDSSGALYFVDLRNSVVRKVSPAETISTVAGTGTPGYSGDGGPATSAQLYEPDGVGVDSKGNLYILDRYNSRIRKVTSDGIITTVAGNGTFGLSGDGGPATMAQIRSPFAIAVDAPGNLYIAETSSVRKVSADDGIIRTIAGKGTSGYSGDGGPALNAELGFLRGIAVDLAGNVYVADGESNAVRRLQPAGPVLSVTAVINGASGLSGPIAPGELIVITGSGLGPADRVTGPIDDPQVKFDGVPAHVSAAEASQIVAVAPVDIAGKKSTRVQVQYGDETSSAITVPVAASAPGLFKGAIVNEDGSLNLASNPAARGSVVTLLATGIGQSDQQTGLPQLSIIAGINDAGAMVVSVGPAPDAAEGIVQISVAVPDDAPSGSNIPIVIAVGGVFSQPGVTIAIQ
jgi:uncharacterized protein (TIGR03437 family)